ncbi:MAG TPA: cell division protein ZipA C-terminal FtsZ-binding domain-containing protein [Steroidobacteraceae bacterium]|nr:cell division protein ZipA C-terminal FtsZ-binding domain-containing protein [Steroidobacteraceae bacterium]
MPELRWTLLIIGVLFVVILAWWERRRPHQASRQAPHIGGEPRPVVTDDVSWGTDGASGNSRVIREPGLTLPEIRTEVRSPAPDPAPASVPPMHTRDREREPTSPRELPVIEILDDSLIGLRVDGDRVEDEVDDEEEIDEEPEEMPVVVEEAKAPAVELPPPPTHIEKPIVDWPPEDQRTLVSLRLVARPPDRFRGNLLRQALAAEGFVLGDLDIFHKPNAENRAVLSAASLTKPGTFDLETMDIQRFTGLNLFAVLPGPKSPQKAFEDLLLTARTLNERLEGALQDERGGPLTPMRIQALRDALGAEAKS